MKHKSINFYQYSELSDTAKEKARDWYREASQNDTFREYSSQRIRIFRIW